MCMHVCMPVFMFCNILYYKVTFPPFVGLFIPWLPPCKYKAELASKGVAKNEENWKRGRFYTG